uniref:Uncharacterized protein n=1 Tax=Triticum urartu TaxID=4572 RepID=A0A8R7P4C2_TRIUA
MDGKLSPVGNNCISSATSSVSPLHVSLHASSPSTKPRRDVGHQPKATSQES